MRRIKYQKDIEGFIKEAEREIDYIVWDIRGKNGTRRVFGVNRRQKKR